MYDIGILQGRLSSGPAGRLQFFPADWRQEFPLVRQLGLAGIEWLVHPDNWRQNPIFSGVLDHGTDYGAPITSICADWFMEVCLWEGDPAEHLKNLRSLIKPASLTLNRVILLPLLKKYSISDQSRQAQTREILSPLKDDLEKAGVSIAFETELPASELLNFVDSFGSNNFGVYYDTGNAASYNFDCAAEIRLLGKRVKGVHIKDRQKGNSQSVPLGAGDVDFIGVFRALADVGWNGTLIMQAWRGEDYLADAKNQIQFLIDKQKEAFQI